jgi:superfamily II DNA or RNA helicase
MTKQDEIQELALNKVKSENLNRFSMDIGTGIGKSLLAIKHMNSVLHEYSMFLIVLPKKPLEANWLAEFKKHGYEHLIPHVHFTLYRSIHKLLKTYDWVYYDECHNFKTGLHYKAAEQLSTKSFALTGSYINDKNINYKQFTETFPLIFVYKTRMSVKEQILNDYRIIIHKIPLSKTARCNSYLNGYLPETQAYITVNSAVLTAEKQKKFASLEKLRIIRMKMLQNANSKVYYAKKLLELIKEKTIIFTESTDHADKICLNSFHSKNSKFVNEKNMNNFAEGKLLQLSAVGQLDEGINVPDLEKVLILHSYANNIKAKQRIGRALRLGGDSGKIAYIHIIVYQNTVDEDWCKNAISDFDNSKIGYYSEEKTNFLLKSAGLI